MAVYKLHGFLYHFGFDLEICMVAANHSLSLEANSCIICIDFFRQRFGPDRFTSKNTKLDSVICKFYAV